MQEKQLLLDIPTEFKELEKEIDLGGKLTYWLVCSGQPCRCISSPLQKVMSYGFLKGF